MHVGDKIVQLYQRAMSSGGTGSVRKNGSVILIPKRSLLDISLPCLSAIWVLVFLVCSVLSIVWYGYFYCICALHIVVNNDILQRVLRAVTKNGNTHTRVRTHTHTHTHTHTNTHTHLNMHAHTQTRTHTLTVHINAHTASGYVKILYFVVVITCSSLVFLS